MSRGGKDQPKFVWSRSVRAVLDSTSREGSRFVSPPFFRIQVSYHHACVGITLEPTFSRRSTHLLCPTGTGAKFDKALEWRIPIVSLVWLEDIARTGTIPCVDEYLVAGSHVQASVDGEDGFRYTQHLHADRERAKGKGKEREMDCQMVDITNGKMPMVLFLWHAMLISNPDGSANRSLFIRNAALLQDTVPRGVEQVAEHYRGKSLESGPPARSALFGKPRFLTHDSDPPEEVEADEDLPTSSPPAPPPQSSSPPLAEAELPLPGPFPAFPAFLEPIQTTPIRQPSGSIHDAEIQVPAPTPTQGRIPSSSSPSPMKLPRSSSIPNAFARSSPARLPDTDAITKALHESLTSLLGKRPIAEEDEEMKDAGGVKKGKRVRPGGQSNV